MFRGESRTEQPEEAGGSGAAGLPAPRREAAGEPAPRAVLSSAPRTVLSSAVAKVVRPRSGTRPGRDAPLVQRAAPAHPRLDTGAEREALRQHLTAARIAGEVATPRENNLRSYRMLADREPRHLFGLEPDGHWDFRDVLRHMAVAVGVSPDPRHLHGPDRIDVERTLDRLDAYADRLAAAALRRERLVLATGHPGGLRTVYAALGRALAAAGCQLLTPAADWGYQARTLRGDRDLRLRYVDGVAVLAEGTELVHTHSARPVRAMLAALAREGGPLPDLVIGDHGWAGGAGQAGIDTIGMADSNDPALFVGEAEGLVSVVVPLDDNVAPVLYQPVTDYLLHRAGLWPRA